MSSKKTDKKSAVKEAKENAKNQGHGHGGGTWGVKSVGKVANKYPKNWGQKGMKSNNSGND